MKRILVDSSVWIDYFRGSKKAAVVNDLIDENQLCINDLILSELIPFLRIKKENRLIDILKAINKIPINIDWAEIIDFQEINLRNGINKVGIADLIIVQNVRYHQLCLYSHDKHFELMSKFIKYEMF